ncbi:Peptidase S10, serine carboxypeptidase [Corchorus olitorius]|uniref:Peptidase S10, serine carboxypeptidase n=1 Tax=Corchorus olitorius TaxID=93759 RepID=A0A1R3HKD4_9ROSI|nr:Peptidase S10, serine carboxypeptidase [Corchorus olitorius]
MATSQSLVKFLPGFEGPLPFKLETGFMVSSIIFVDSPVGTGFSYATNQIAAQSNDFKQVHHLNQFLRKSLERNCHGEYKDIDPSNIKCLKDYEYYSECISGINSAHILEPLCVFASPKPQEMSATRRYLDEQLPTIECRTYSYLLSHYWANDGNVQKALNVRKGSIKQWKRCNYGIPYTTLLGSTFQYHVNLSARGCPALVYRYTRSYANKMTFATVKASKL